MMTLSTAMTRRLEATKAKERMWREAWGLILLSIGLYLGLACYSFHYGDYAKGGLNPGGVTNLGGPLGAYASAHILGRFGLVGLLWPILFAIWGILTATGRVVLPKAKRFLGLVLISIDLAGLSEIFLTSMGLTEPSFGYGGTLGHFLAHSLKARMGMAGAVIGLGLFGVLALLFTDNLSMTMVTSTLQEVRYHGRRFLRRHGRRVVDLIWQKVWVEWLQQRSVDESKSPLATPSLSTGTRSERRSEASPQREQRSSRVSPSSPPTQGSLDLVYGGPAHGRPEPKDFSRSIKAPDRSSDLSLGAQHLVEQLAEFRIIGEIRTVTQGPIVTTYEFKPAPGTKVSKIAALGEDLARLLKAQSLRVLAPIPGKDTVGFEVPNVERAVIGFADLISAPSFADPKKRLPIAMGVDIFGVPIIEDLAEMPHLLVAGSTGSGKSVFMNSLIASLIARHTAESLRLIMIDPKMVELAAYNGLPHMACPVITDPQLEAKSVLAHLVIEMDERYQRMKALGARNIDAFNTTVKTSKKHDFMDFDGAWTPMPYIVLIIDEMADMMMQLGREAELPIARLAQKARAAGIHMVIATQRPTADVVTGLIKANFPTRVAFRVMSGIDSRTILDQGGAESLLGKGDMLYLASGGARRLHGAYLSDTEVQGMVRAARKKKY
jgi:S-DNA-T family DNA segregation ATPase FtsK/SpoIIIE